MTLIKTYSRWLTVGLRVKRWLLLLIFGVFLIIVALAALLVRFANPVSTDLLIYRLSTLQLLLIALCGVCLFGIAFIRLSRNLLAPFRTNYKGTVIDVVYTHSRRNKGLRVVAIGGGTGLPSVLRGLKVETSNITAVVTVADDGGSSGKLRRELGVQPPGDIRNNIAALADDESLITRLFQFRFDKGDLQGHSFGNLFIAALAGVSGGMENALPEVERVLNIQGRVLPATLQDVNLVASIRQDGKNRPIRVQGESKISEMGGLIEELSLNPPEVEAFSESVAAIEDADLIVIGPGSLYTSIIPNLLVNGIAEAVRNSKAYKVYVCNVATQPGETEDFTVGDHVLALEKYIGRGVFQAVLANNATPERNAGENTFYVRPISYDHEISQRYEVRYTDLTDEERPWRHDPQKLAGALLSLYEGDELEQTSFSDSVLTRV